MDVFWLPHQNLHWQAINKRRDDIIGNTILSNEQLVRRLVVLGWDTLEIHGENATYGCKWKLADHMETINLLNS